MSLADVVIAVGLAQAFQTVIDVGLQKAVKEVNKWATELYASPEFTAVQGSIHLCTKPIKPATKAD